MYIDAQLQFSQAQALVATAASTNAVDFGKDRNIGIGKPMAILVTVGVSPAGGGTLQITVQADTTSAFGAPVTVAQTIAIAAANLTAGTKVIIPIPADLSTDRWMRLNYTMVTMTSITVTAELVTQDAVQNEWYAPAGTTIS